jgi:hypothetical protein
MTVKRLDPKVRFLLMKELDNYVNSPRKLQLNSEEFRSEVSREIGHTLTLRHVEGCAESFGLRMADIFKPRAERGGRSIYSEVYMLKQRIEALEKKLEGL